MTHSVFSPRPDRAGSSEHVVVVGAGIVGLMTAYFLAEDGISVTLIEREENVASVCSSGNAGILAIGHAEAWAGPDAYFAMTQAFLGRNPAVKLQSLWDPKLMSWGFQFLRNCTARRHKANSRKLLELSLYSRGLMTELDARLKFSYSQQDSGTLYLFRDEKQFQARRDGLEKVGANISGMKCLTRDEVFAIEPALQSDEATVAGGVFSPRDGSGDCFSFATQMGEHLRASGRVELICKTMVTGFEHNSGRVHAVQTDAGQIPCDAVVLAGGSATPHLLECLNLTLPLYPVKGYSITYPINDTEAVPTTSVVDETALVAFARYGDRMRLTGFAEFDRGRLRIVPEHIDALQNYAERTFGDSVDLGAGIHWNGSRPTTPSSLPYVGRLKMMNNIWVNAGHGQLGWTMAAGSGRLIASHICGKDAEMSDVSGKAECLIGI